MNKYCQMTVGGWNERIGFVSYDKCFKPAKYRVPEPKMNVEYVCGIHARSLNVMYRRTGQVLKCEKLKPEVK